MTQGSENLDRSLSRDEIRTLARGGLALGVTTAVSLALSIPTVALLVRELGVTDYGALVFTLSVIGLATAFADLGLTSGLARMASVALTERDRANFGRSGLAIGTVSGAAAAGACALIALVVQEPTRSVLLIASPLAFLLTLRSVLTAYLRVSREIKLVEGSNAAGQIAYYLSAMLLVAVGVATSSNVVLLRLLVACCVLALMLRTWRRLTTAATRSSRAWRSLLRFSIPLLIGNVAWLVMQQSDVVLLGFFRGSADVGFYAPVLQTVDLLTTVLFVLTAYYIPLASGAVGRGDFQQLRALYVTVTKWGLVLCSPVLAALTVAPAPLLGALFGEQWRSSGSTDLARVLAVGYAASILTGQNGATLIAIGRSRTLAVSSSFALVANLALNVLLIPRFGALGAAIGTAVAYIGLNVMNSCLLWRDVNVHPVRNDYKIVLATVSGLAFLSLLLVNSLGWDADLRAPLISALLVGAGAAGAWYLTSPTEERRSFW